MALPTATQFGKLAVENKLLTPQQLQSTLTELGMRAADLSTLITALIRKEYLTNFQVERLKEGKDYGYFHGDYKLLYYVGAGYATRVFRAINVNDKSVRAVKVLRNRFFGHPYHFIRESEQSIILNHPNIVRVFEVGKRTGEFYAVEEFVEGQDLHSFLKSRGKLQAQEALPILADICAALQYAHDLGIHHRNLKISNVILTSKGQAKVGDFCPAAAKSAPISRTDMPEETSYMRACDYDGLEKAGGVSRGDFRSDIFFAGCILYELLCGVPPVDISHERLVKTDPQQYAGIPPLTQYVANTVPGLVLSVVRKAMEINPAKRFQTPAALLHEINVVMDKLENTPASSSIFSNSALENTSSQALTLHSFMLVEGDPRLQEKIREIFKKVNWRILITVNPQRAVDLFYRDKEVAECLVFLCKSLNEDVIKVFNNLNSLDTTASRMRAIIVLEPSQTDWISRLCTDNWRVILQKPLTANELLREMKALIKKPLN